MNSRLPNFFVVGAGKAGTTSLYNYLKAHPQIFMSPIKEPNHFATDIDASAFSEDYRRTLLHDVSGYVRGDMTEPVHIAHVSERDDYLKLFRQAGDALAVGEISNSYLNSTTAAAEIRSAVPHARIVMILRDPVDRAYSQYLMDVRIGYVRRPFVEELEADLAQPDKSWGGEGRGYVERGLYHDHVRRYLDTFPRDQVAIYLFEDMRQDLVGLLGQLYGFLGVDSDFVPADLGKSNAAQVPRTHLLNFLLFQSGFKTILQRVVPAGLRPLLKRLYYAAPESRRLDETERGRMIGFFRDDIRRLEVLIDRDLSRWVS